MRPRLQGNNAESAGVRSWKSCQSRIKPWGFSAKSNVLPNTTTRRSQPTPTASTACAWDP